MFSLKVVDTDSFLDMSPTAQNLYFHLGMRADDDGFISAPKKIMQFTNASDDDYKILIAKGFIIPMVTNGICVVTHWKINNLIRPDRYVETEYLEEKSRLALKNGKYTQDFIIGKPNVIPLVTLGKVRLGNIYISDKSDVGSSFQTKPKENWVKSLITWYETTFGLKFANYGKQIGALGRLAKSGYAAGQIKDAMEVMWKTDFWKDKNPDFTNLASNITKYAGKEIIRSNTLKND